MNENTLFIGSVIMTILAMISGIAAFSAAAGVLLFMGFAVK